MRFAKSSAALVARFGAALPESPLVLRRKMFGYPCAFVRGNFFAGLHEENVVLRLPGDLRASLPALAKGEAFDPMKNGRVMKDWVVVPKGVAASAAKLTALLAAALPLVAALPPKAALGKKAAGTRTAAGKRAERALARRARGRARRPRARSRVDRA